MLSAVLFFLCIVAIVLQVIALCGNIGSSLRSVYYVRVDTRLASSFLDDIRHNLLKIPDYLTFAAFVICQGFTTGSSSSSIICTQPSLGYRYDADGFLGLFERAIPDRLHNTLSVAQGGVIIPSVCFAFLAALMSLLGCCFCRTQGPKWLGILVGVAFAFAVAALAIIIAAYRAILDSLDKVEAEMPGQLVQFDATPGSSIWLTVGAVIALLLALVIYIFAMYRGRRQRQRRQQRQDELELSYV